MSVWVTFTVKCQGVSNWRVKLKLKSQTWNCTIQSLTDWVGCWPNYTISKLTTTCSKPVSFDIVLGEINSSKWNSEYRIVTDSIDFFYQSLDWPIFPKFEKHGTRVKPQAFKVPDLFVLGNLCSWWGAEPLQCLGKDSDIKVTKVNVTDGDQWHCEDKRVRWTSN